MKLRKKDKEIEEFDYNSLLQEVTEENDYEQWLKERQEILPLTKEGREQVESIIRIKILQILKQVKDDKLAYPDDKEVGWFKYKPYFEIEEIKDYFPIRVFSGDRNIGKSTSSREEMVSAVRNNGRFLFFRNIDDEVKEQVSSHEETFLFPNGWTNAGSAKLPNIVDMQGNLVGWYRAMNTSAKFKSIDFPNTKLIIWEEFNEVKIQNPFMKFVKMVSTAQRHNPDCVALIQANYVDQFHEVLQALGLGYQKLTNKDIVAFNWEAGAIIVNIPKGIYNSTQKDKSKDLGYRASLTKYDAWKAQYGGGFSNEQPINIVEEKKIVAVEPQFNIYYQNTSSLNKTYGAFKMTLYHAYDEDGKKHNILTETKGSNNCPIFIYDILNKILYPHANLMDIDSLDNLIYEWNIGNLKTTSLEVHSKITVLLANAKRALMRNEEDIEKIENIIV